MEVGGDRAAVGDTGHSLTASVGLVDVSAGPFRRCFTNISTVHGAGCHADSGRLLVPAAILSGPDADAPSEGIALELREPAAVAKSPGAARKIGVAGPLDLGRGS